MEEYLWLFGAGYWGRKFLLEKSNLKCIKGIVDNDEEKCGKIFYGFTIYSYKEWLKTIDINRDKIIIACRKEYAEEIVVELAKDNIHNLITGIFFENKIFMYEELYATNIYSQFGEDLGIRNFFSVFGTDYKGFYVDVGCFHPFWLSNTKQLYDRGWRGINIDPNAVNIQLFKAYRPEDINLCCGISDENGIMPYYKYTQPVCNSFDNSLKRKLILKNVVDIPVRKLGEILEEYKVEKIDILDIDAEGFDEKIVKSFEWEKYMPTCILVEILSEKKRCFWTLEIHKILEAHGYKFESLFVKTLMYVKNNLDI